MIWLVALFAQEGGAGKGVSNLLVKRTLQSSYNQGITLAFSTSCFSHRACPQEARQENADVYANKYHIKGVCPKEKANSNTTTYSVSQSTTVMSISVRDHKAEARIRWCTCLCGRSNTNKQQVMIGAVPGSKMGFKGAKRQQYGGTCSSCRRSVLPNLRSGGVDCSLGVCVRSYIRDLLNKAPLYSSTGTQPLYPSATRVKGHNAEAVIWWCLVPVWAEQY